MKKLLPSVVFALLISISLHAQTLINLASIDTIGQYINYQATETATNDGSNNYMMFNFYQTGESSNFAIVKMDVDNNVLWVTMFNSPGNKSDFGVADYYKNNYLYATGFSYDSATSTSVFNTLKLDASTGDTLWSKSYQGSYAGYAAPSQVIADDTGNVYVTGAAQTATGAALVLIKYDSSGNQLWASTWDSIGLYNGGVAMVISPGSNIAVTGFSGGAFTSFDFVTCWFSFDGSLLSTARSTNGSGTFSRPVAIQHDQFNGTMIIGSAATYGGNSVIKIVCYDTNFVLQHVITWGDSSKVTTASGMAQDNAGNMIVSGTTTNASGGKNAVLINFQGYPPLTYSWVKQINAPDPAKEASAAAVTFDKYDNPLITGRVYSGGHFNLLTAGWDINGNALWSKTYSGGAGTDNAGTSIMVDDYNHIKVGASSIRDTNTIFIILTYQQYTLSSQSQSDSSGNPLYIQNQVLVKFDQSAVIRAQVDDPKITFGNASTYLQPWAVDSLQKALWAMPTPIETTFDLSECRLAKVFTRLKTTDTISLSRLGERVPIPDFWTTFILTFEPGIVSEEKLCITLNKQFPFVQDAELDRVARLASTGANDKQYNLQYSLHQVVPQHPYDPSYPNSDINVEPAWAYTTGQPYIKVGIVDDGLLLTHTDFQIDTDPDFSDTFAYTVPIALGGWDFYTDANLQNMNLGLGHGTKVGGVIGAVRNDDAGVAGIAGGNDSVPGVSLYGFRVFAETVTGDEAELASAHNLAEAIVELSGQSPDSIFGWGMHILNNSYFIIPNDTIYFNTHLTDSFASEGYFIESNWSTLRDAYHFANRNQVIQTAASGNSTQTAPSLRIVYPAAFDSIWMVITGGTSTTGGWMGASDTFGGVDYFMSCYGPGMAIAAPADTNLVETTWNNDGNNTSNRYGAWGKFDGTSSATAHVSGVAALLLSYLNDRVPNYRNLAPEDVEYMIEHSATDIESSGWDTLTGWGRLNAGGALNIADTAQRKLYHFDSDSNISISQINSGIHIWLAERARNNNNTGQVFLSQKYTADVYQVTCTITLPFSDTTTLVAAWERPSSSNTYPYFDGDSNLVPHERIFIQGITRTSAVVTGYIYHLYDTLTNASIGWLPMDTTQAVSANFAISVMVGDSLPPQPIDTTITTSITTIKTEKSQISIYPNPASDDVMIQAASNCRGTVKLSIYNMEGIEIQGIFNGTLGSPSQKFPYKVSNLADGVYFVNMQSDCETYSLKFVKL